MSRDPLVGRKARGDYYDPLTWRVFLQAGQPLDQEMVDRLEILGLTAAEAELQGLSLELGECWIGWGRYKSAVAAAVLRPGSGKLRINGQPVWEYFEESPGEARDFLHRLLQMNEVSQLLANIDGIVRVEGSTPKAMRQPKAVAHAIARALMGYHSELKKHLKQRGFGGVKIKNGEKI